MGARELQIGYENRSLAEDSRRFENEMKREIAVQNKQLELLERIPEQKDLLLAALIEWSEIGPANEIAFENAVFEMYRSPRRDDSLGERMLRDCIDQAIVTYAASEAEQIIKAKFGEL